MRKHLVERARNGDREAFGLLAAGEIDRLHAIATLILRDPDLAQDAAQEALVRCWRKLPTLREVEQFEAWLNRILMRTVSNELGRRKRFHASVQPLRAEPAVGDSARLLADRDVLEKGFGHLSVAHRSIVVLHHFVGLPLPEAAATLGIRAGTAKSRYHYAMSALRAAVEAEGRLADEALG
jgi:RNA polymerase sigma-70 factor, ECF subfamily